MFKSLEIAKEIGFEFFRSISKGRNFLFSLKAHNDRDLHEFRSEKKKNLFLNRILNSFKTSNLPY